MQVTVQIIKTHLCYAFRAPPWSARNVC